MRCEREHAASLADTATCMGLMLDHRRVSRPEAPISRAGAIRGRMLCNFDLGDYKAAFDKNDVPDPRDTTRTVLAKRDASTAATCAVVLGSTTTSGGRR